MKKVLFLFICFCFISLPSFAEWQEIGKNHYINTENRIVRKNLVRGWFVTYRPAIKTIKGVDAYSWVHQIEADCNYGQIRGFAEVYYDENNNVLDFYQFKDGTNWISVTPDSVGETEYKALCKYRQ